ncbi:toll/interleukin-1 receptor domain-containing protein [Streptomyces sp. NPDC046909]|uniref:toll/interleukin-1 receptor domain-containing protein n=1 Tax=Streptomyces sp. NPDC046909 TaxID=3155617 RepID=UPI0033C6AF17
MDDDDGRVLISYSHDSEEHRIAVRNLTQRLRDAGVGAWIDQFDEHRPPESWWQWMRQRLEKAEFVLVVVTATYVERFNGESPAGVGSGVRWEGGWITADLYHGRRDRAKFLPVVLRREDLALIPYPLNGTASYVVGDGEDTDFHKLVRTLHRTPLAVPAALGTPDSAARFDGDTSVPEVAAALAEARAGRIEEALGRLRDAGARLSGEPLAQAAYLFGVLSHRRGDVELAMKALQSALDGTNQLDLHQRAQGMLDIVASDWNTHHGEQGSGSAARDWLTLLRRKWKTGEVWKRLDDNLRLALAQDWILANASHPWIQGEDRDLLVRVLAEPKPNLQVSKTMLDGRVEALRDHYAAWDPGTWTIPELPRRIGLDYEIVGFAPPGADPPQGFSLLMRRVGAKWLVANFQPAYVIPGWPPRQEEIPGL